MFYIGWADSVLSPSEIKLIHRKIESLPFLTREDKKYLIQWTDPRNPPSDEIFKEWATAIRHFASDIPEEQRSSISNICYQILKATTKESEFPKLEVEVLSAIREMEEALGLNNPVSARLLMANVPGGVHVAEMPSFNIESLRKELDGKYIDTKERMRTLLQDPYFARIIEPDTDKYRLKVLSRLKALANQGLGSYAFPEQYGGMNKRGDHIAVFEMLAYGDLSLTVKFGVQFGLFGGALYLLGSPYHHKLYLEPLSKGDLLGCFAMTETGHGSNVRGLRTTATLDFASGHWIIHTPVEDACKEYIGNALHATMAVVFAQLIVEGKNHGVHAFLVQIRNNHNELCKGVRIEDNGYKMGLNGVDNGKIWFDQVKIPLKNLLNAYGDIDESGKYFSKIENPNKRFFTMLGALVGGRISVGLAGLSVAKVGLHISIKYGLQRKQFEDREGNEMLVMDYPTHHRRLIPLLARTIALHTSLTRLTGDYVDEEKDQRDVETQAAALKAIASWHCTETIQECREACGGKGYLQENLIPQLKADSDIFTTFEGDNTVLLQLVARSLLTEFKEDFHHAGFKAVMRYLGKRLSNTLAELNPFYSRLTSTEHLLNIEFYEHAFEYRENKLLFSLSSRMRDYLRKRLHPHDAFLKCQMHMIEAAYAYTEALILKDFIAFTQRSDASLQPVLKKLLSVYALSVIEKEKGWYLETGYMEGSKTKAIRRMITKLCAELRPEVTGLIEAFGIPPGMADAEMVRNQI